MGGVARASLLAVVVTATAAAASSFGCGARSVGAGADAGGDAAPPPARRSFDVVATLPKGVAGAPTPTPHHFTLVLDAAAGRVIAGGGGEAKVLPATTADGRRFHVTSPFTVGVAASACTGLLSVTYDLLDFTLDGDALRGTAVGRTVSAAGGVTEDPIQFDAPLAGVPDATSPILQIPPGTLMADVVTPFTLWASEPLPATATARLIASDGTSIDLVPEIDRTDVDVPVIARFSKPNVVPAPGGSWQLAFDGLVDFAGRTGGRGAGLRLAAVADAPLVPADGFESTTGPTVGGGAVVRSGPGIPIAGGASVYIGHANAPTPMGLRFAPQLTVRLSVPPGATKVTFSMRQLWFSSMEAGFVRIGSVGHPPGPPTPIAAVPESSSTMVSWGGQTFTESFVAVMEASLPPDHTDEVVVLVQTPPVVCDTGFGSTGLLVDDLRLE